ncbi:MAG: hypothetical protein QM770_08175 [Tepidisphaeraceae bacterium]
MTAERLIQIAIALLALSLLALAAVLSIRQMRNPLPAVRHRPPPRPGTEPADASGMDAADHALEDDGEQDSQPGVTIKGLVWPEVFVVEYRNGQQERLRFEQDGARMGPPTSREVDHFFAWFDEPRRGLAGAKQGRWCDVEDIQCIRDDKGRVLWARDAPDLA